MLCVSKPLRESFNCCLVHMLSCLALSWLYCIYLYYVKQMKTKCSLHLISLMFKKLFATEHSNLWQGQFIASKQEQSRRGRMGYRKENGSDSIHFLPLFSFSINFLLPKYIFIFKYLHAVYLHIFPLCCLFVLHVTFLLLAEGNVFDCN